MSAVTAGPFAPAAAHPTRINRKFASPRNVFNRKPGLFLPALQKGNIKSKKENGEIETLVVEADHYAYETPGFSAQLDKTTLRLIDLKLKNSAIKEVNFKGAVPMSILLSATRELF